MQIDWIHFTPWPSLAGGLLLGLAAALLLLSSGRILGITGIVEGLLPPKAGDTSWRVTFVLGLLLAPVIAKWVMPEGVISAPRIDASWALVVVAGLLVGFGTRYGAGCTSGHGVCGLSRLSPRSMVATAMFMAAGFFTVFVLKHVV